MCETAVQQQFPGDTTKSLYIDDKPLVIKSIGALLDYLKRTQRNGMERMNRIMLYTNAQYMHLDINARRNLELTELCGIKRKEVPCFGCWIKPKRLWENFNTYMVRTSSLSGLKLKNVNLQ